MSIGKHQSAKSKTDEWLTPPEIIQALGEFDLDPCSPVNRPWDTAKQHYTILDNGLLKEWTGRVFLNPPYGNIIDLWMQKMAMHYHGTALTFARTDRNTFHNYVFPVADSLYFIKQRLHFYDVNGVRAKANSGAPSVLIAYGERDSERLASSGIKGHHVPINTIGVTVIGYDRSWQLVIKAIFIRLNRPASLDELYNEVERVAPEKVERNQHFKAKVRQVVQQYFNQVKRGVWQSN